MSKTKDKAKLEYDLILVGGAPSNLTLAHRLVDLVKANPEKYSNLSSSKPLKIAIIEKAENFGGHIVSGAVVTKSIFDKVFPDHRKDGMPIESVCEESHFSLMAKEKKWDMPNVLTRMFLPDFVKDGYYILTLSMVVKWMAENLIEKAKDVPGIQLDMFPGFPVNEILFEGDKVVGVKVSNTGDELEDNVYAKVVSFADKGFVSKDIIKKFDLAQNPQLWSVGVKETWKLKEGSPNIKGKVWHTLGYPTLDGTLGGGFIYGLNYNRVTFGLVISLDSPNPNIHPQRQLQEYKKHPFLQELLKDGELQHYGAAVLPEGGLASLPKQFQVDGALLLGDALGLLDMKALAGVDKAMESGYIAAEVILDAFKANDFSQKQLSKYQERLMESPYMDKLKSNRYFRKAFSENPALLKDYLPKVLNGVDQTGNPIAGALAVGLTDPIKAPAAALRSADLLFNAEEIKEEIKYKEGHTLIDPDFPQDLIDRTKSDLSYDKDTIYNREDAVFYAHTKYNYHPEHIDEFKSETCLRCIKTYEARNLDVPCVSDCTAEVHRLDTTGDGIKVHAMSLENCVMCRTCELICPESNLRVNAAYSGSGPDTMGL